MDKKPYLISYTFFDNSAKMEAGSNVLILTDVVMNHLSTSKDMQKELDRAVPYPAKLNHYVCVENTSRLTIVPDQTRYFGLPQFTLIEDYSRLKKGVVYIVTNTDLYDPCWYNPRLKCFQSYFDAGRFYTATTLEGDSYYIYTVNASTEVIPTPSFQLAHAPATKPANSEPTFETGTLYMIVTPLEEVIVCYFDGKAFYTIQNDEAVELGSLPIYRLQYQKM